MAYPFDLEHHALLTAEALAKDGTTVAHYASTPSANSVGTGRCGNESLSFLPKLHNTPCMYRYLQVGILQYAPGLRRPRFGSIIVFLKNVKGLGYEVIDAGQTQIKLAEFNVKAKPSSSSLKLTMTTPKIHLDFTDSSAARLAKLSRNAIDDVDRLCEITAISNSIDGLVKLEMVIPFWTDDAREELYGFCRALERGVKTDKSNKAKKWPLAPWFVERSSTSTAPRLSLEGVTRLGEDFPGIPPQPALACFVDVEHYIVTQAVGTVNEHESSAANSKKDSYVKCEARIFNHAEYSVGINQFFLLVFPKDAEQHNGPASPPRPKICRIKLSGPEIPKGRGSPSQSAEKPASGTETQIDKDLSARRRISRWWFARRFDGEMPNLPTDAQVYLVNMPTEAGQSGVKRPVNIDLPFITVNGDHRSFEALMNHPQQSDLKVQIRGNEFDNGLLAEMAALERLSSPLELLVTYPASVRAFEYLIDFTPRPDTPTVDLWDKLPGVSKLTLRGAWKALPPSLCEAFTRTLKKKELAFLSSLCNIEAGMSFLAHDDESNATQLILCLIAGAIYGVDGGECPSMYVSATNKNLDDFSEEAGRFFKSLGLKKTPDVLRLSSKDIHIVSRSSAEIPSELMLNDDNVSLVDYFMKQSRKVSAANGLEAMQPQFNGVTTIHEAAYRYYLANKHSFRRIKALLSDLRLRKQLDVKDSAELQAQVEKLYTAMLRDFKGIVCTTPALAANEWVRNFDPAIVFLADAGQMRELSSLIPIAYYMPHAWMFFGNPEGRRPFVSREARGTQNPFVDQLGVSVLERALRLGKNVGRLQKS